MPTYDYKCEACGHAFEKFHSIKASPIRKCPKCGKLKVRRLMSWGAGLIFKGSGFYITDYRSEGYKSAAKADSGTGGDSGAKASGGETAPSKPADAKPAASESKAATKTSDQIVWLKIGDQVIGHEIPWPGQKVTMRCPICKKPVKDDSPQAPSWLPFCSERCKLIDLGRWLDGKYSIPVDETHESADLPAEPTKDD